MTLSNIYGLGWVRPVMTEFRHGSWCCRVGRRGLVGWLVDGAVAGAD